MTDDPSVILKLMRALALALMTVALAALSACAGSSAEDTYRDSAGRAVKDSILTLENLPEGWTQSEVREQALSGLSLTGDCEALNRLGRGFPGEVATGDSEPFAGPRSQQLASTVSAFTDTTAAQAAVQRANELVVQCRAQIEDALKQAIRDAAGDLGRLIGEIDSSVEPGEFKSLGDETSAYALKANVSTLLGGVDVNGHILIIRKGPLTGVLIYANLGDLDAREEEGIASALATKLTSAETSLPR
jgi:hypothetical protein